MTRPAIRAAPTLDTPTAAIPPTLKGLVGFNCDGAEVADAKAPVEFDDDDVIVDVEKLVWECKEDDEISDVGLERAADDVWNFELDSTASLDRNV
jgi:hypothetical protein